MRSVKTRTFPLFHLFTFELLSVLSAHRTRARVHRPLLTETAAVTLARVSTFQFRFLSRRNEVSVLFEVFDDLLRDDLSFEPAQSRLDRFVRIN